jgi:HEAT repeat protein
VVPALIELFRDEDPETRRWASGAIGVIGRKAEPYLLKAQKDPDPIVRKNIAETLESLKLFAD